MYTALLAFVLLWLSTYLLGGSCRRNITGIDPTTGRKVLIRDYTECGASCKFRENRNRVLHAFRSCRLSQISGAVCAVAALALFAWAWTHRVSG
jgi:asparagine N-glycosylation enzyme membrane subunit Stt3